MAFCPACGLRTYEKDARNRWTCVNPDCSVIFFVRGVGCEGHKTVTKIVRG